MAQFHVDLRGMVDLLSRNLYSGPRVYMRELLQNGVDAIAARRQLEPDCPARIVLTVGDGGLACSDTGIGLTEEEAASLLSTIGASSKRDELGLARADFLGQFGIGLLSCFMVSPDITVVSRSARAGADGAIEWTGSADGTYCVRPAPAHEARGLPPGPGTRVVLRPFPGEAWMEPATVRALVDEFASLLDADIEVRGGGAVTRHGRAVPVWRMGGRDRAQWCQENLGFAPIDVIDFDIAAAGLRGAIAISPQEGRVGDARHTVYAKGMLVSRSAYGLAPPWAYFAWVVADSAHLRLTASREQLVDDEALEDARAAVGERVRAWLDDLARHAPTRFAAFVSAHAMGLRSVATTDGFVLGLVVEHVPFETTQGPRTLAQLAGLGVPVRYTRTVDQYRALADVAARQGVVLVNAGYAYEEEVLSAFLASPALGGSGADIALVDPARLLDSFSPCSPTEEAEAAGLMLAARRAIDPRDCEVVMRRFEPATMPALYLPDPDLAGRQVARASKEAASGVWAQLLGIDDPFARTRPPRMVLNRANPLIARLAALDEGWAAAAQVLRGLYVQCLLQGRQALGPKERAWAGQVLGALIDAALDHPRKDGP